MSNLFPQLSYWNLDNNGLDISRTTGKLGIGTATPKATFQVGEGFGSSVSMGEFIYEWDLNNTSDRWLSNYFGFNATRDKDYQTSDKWNIADGAGASIMASNLRGDLRIITIAGSNDTNNVSRRMTDNQILDNEKLIIRNDGKIGIGTSLINVPLGFASSTNPYRLYVTGGIRSEKVTVDIASENGWADYVFDGSYSLLTIEQLEHYIHANKHLPGIPSSNEIKQNGIDVSEMLSKQMEKIEELTLYLIEMKKENESLSKKINSIESSK